MKEYKAELVLQDKFTQTIEKALQATKQFRAQIVQVQKDVDKLGKSKVTIPVKLDTSSTGINSFTYIQNEINRLNKQKITLHATANTAGLTANMAHVGETLGVSLNESINSAMGRARAEVSALNSAADNANYETGGSGSNLALTGSIGALAAAVASMNHPAVGGASKELALPEVTSHMKSVIDKIGSSFGNLIDKLKAKFPSNSNYEIHENTRMFGEKWTLDPNYATMIARQQAAYSAAGHGAYLKNKTVLYDNVPEYSRGEQGPPGNPAEVVKSANALARAMDSMKQKASSVAASIGQTFAGVIESIKSKMASISIFTSLETKWASACTFMKSKWDSASEAISAQFNAIKSRIASSPIIMNMQFTGERALYALTHSLETVRNTVGKVISGFRSLSDAAAHPIIAKVIDMATTVIKKIWAGLKTIAGKAWNVVVKVATGAAHLAISGIKKALDALKNAAKISLTIVGAAAAAAVISGIKGGSAMEQNEVSMNHFFGLTSGSKMEAANKTTAYMDYLNQYANKTPFSNNEVMDAGRRAVTVTGGDMNQSKDLVTLAGNMAALNPGKSVMDAMEALADLKTGETERMKEFGFKISQDDIKKAGGTDAYFKSQTSGKGAIGKTYEGGADKLADTAAGKWSTLAGNAQYYASLAGRSILDQLKGPMDKVNEWFDKNGPKLKTWASGVGAGFSKVLTAVGNFSSGVKAGFAPFLGPIQKNLKSAADSFGKMFKGGAGEGIKQLGSTVGTVVGKIIQFVSKVVKFIADHAPEIKAVITEIKNTFIQVMAWLQPRLDKVVAWFQKNGPQIKQIIKDIWDGLKKFCQDISPYLDTLGSIIKLIADTFILAWPGIKIVVETLWGAIKSPLDLIRGAVQLIVDVVQKAIDKFNELRGVQASTSTDNPATSRNEAASSAGRGGGVSRAIGERRVPYDNYAAILHQNEMVLTRNEADIYRSSMGRNGKNIASTQVSSVASKTYNNTIQNLEIKVEGSGNPDKVAQQVVKKIKEVVTNMGGGVPNGAFA